MSGDGVRHELPPRRLITPTGRIFLRGVPSRSNPPGIPSGAFFFAGTLILVRNRLGMPQPMAVLNEPQSRAILCGFLDVHRRMAELEARISPDERPSSFSEYVNDLSPTEAKVVQDYFARIRTAMLGHLKESRHPPRYPSGESPLVPPDWHQLYRQYRR